MINNVLLWLDRNADKIDIVYAVGILFFSIFVALICAVVF